MDVDDCFVNVVGSFGRYQICTYAFLSIYLLFLTSHTFLTVFVAVNPSDLMTVNPRAKSDSSILFEWELTSRPWIGDLIQTLYFAGNLVGVVFFSQLSDKYGRRPTLLIVLGLLFPVCIWTSFTTSWQTFACARFFTGVLQGSAGLVLYVYMQEVVGRKWWAFAGAFTNILFALGIGALAAVAFYIPAWRQLTRTVTYIQLVPFVYAIFLPESPRWLYSVGKITDAEQVLRFMAHQNGKKNEKFSLHTKSTFQQPDVTSEPSALDLFKHNITRTRLILLIALWFANSFVYYALTLAAGSIGSNIYASATLSGLIELPSTLLSTFMIERRRFGRRRTLTLFMIASGVACFAVLKSQDTALAWGLAGKMMIAAGFNVIYVFTPELFPTSVRNVALGSCLMSARFGSMAASMTKSLNPFLAYFIFGVSSITAGFLSVRLPETLGSKPPDSFDELLLDKK